MYSSIQELLLKAVRGEDCKAEFYCVTDFLWSGRKYLPSKTQLQVFPQTAALKIGKRDSILDVIQFLKPSLHLNSNTCQKFAP